MSVTRSRSKSSKTKSAKSLIPADIEKACVAVENATFSHGVKFAPWQDAVLLKYWKKKKKLQLAKVIGFCRQTCKKRLEELTANAKK